MRQWIKRPALWISLGVLIAAGVLGGAALRRSRKAEPVLAAEMSSTTEAAAIIMEAEPTTELATEESTQEPTTEEPTIAAPQKPSTKAEIVAYFNESANRVKAEQPGYTWKDRVLIDQSAIECSNRMLDALAPRVLRVVSPIAKFGQWQKQDGIAKGADHKGFPVENQSWASRLEPGFVKSATCMENGGEYQIKIVLADEDVPALPKDATATRTGKVMNAWDASMLEDAKMAEPFVTITNFGTNYRDCQIACAVDKKTGSLKQITYTVSCILEIDVKQFGKAHASLPFTREEAYVINN